MRIAITGKQESGKTFIAEALNKCLDTFIFDVSSANKELPPNGIFCFQEETYCNEKDFDYIIKVKKNGN